MVYYRDYEHLFAERAACPSPSSHQPVANETAQGPHNLSFHTALTARAQMKLVPWKVSECWGAIVR